MQQKSKSLRLSVSAGKMNYDRELTGLTHPRSAESGIPRRIEQINSRIDAETQRKCNKNQNLRVSASLREK